MQYEICFSIPCLSLLSIIKVQYRDQKILGYLPIKQKLAKLWH